MKPTVELIFSSKTKQAMSKVNDAALKAFKDVVVDIVKDTIAGSPVLTGTNRRGIQFDIKGLEASIYGTTGYSGYLETGTARMPARPYFKPALDRHIHKLGPKIKTELII